MEGSVKQQLNHLLLCILATTAIVGSASAAEIEVGTLLGPPRWTSGGQTSKPNGTPLELQVQKGDIIKFKLTSAHGLITIDKEDAAEPDLVITCAQTATKEDEKKAVLKQVDCNGTSTIFNPDPGAEEAGEIHLEVEQNFQEDVRFWCTVHTAGMRGKIRLKSQ
jgi:plastocyanin